jgi:hypothetical protein
MTNRITGILASALLLAAASPSQASFEELEVGIEAQAMGGTGVVTTGIGGIFWNPASVAGSTSPAVTVAGRLQWTDFDWKTLGLDGIFPVSEDWTTGASIRYFGGDLYSEQTVALTAAGRLTKDMSVGIQPVFCRAAIEDGVSSYGSGTAIAFNLGFQVTMYQRWMIAAAVRNPFQARIGDSGEYLQRKIDGGISYESSPGMVTAVTISRDFRGTRLHVGQSLPIGGSFSLMAGVQNSPTTVSGGFSVEVEGILFQYAAQSHPELAPTHQAGVTYVF